MAGGKETPRQKMIGMMYLVLTALLALNVSKEIINAFVKLDAKLLESQSAFKSNGQAAYDKLKAQSLMPGMKDQVAPYIKHADWVKAEAGKMADYIMQCKDDLIKAVEGESYIKTNKNGKKEFRSLMDIQTKDDYDAATRLYGGDPSTEGYKKGEEIRQKLHKFRNDLTSYLAKIQKGNKPFTFDGSKIANPQFANNEEKFVGSINKALESAYLEDRDALRQIFVTLSTPDKLKDHEEEVAWQLGMFDHAPIVAGAALFTALENDVRNAEAKALEFIGSKVNSPIFNFNKIEPLAFSRTGYLNTGDSMTLRVMIAAYDSTEVPQIKYNDGSGEKEIKGYIPIQASSPGEKEITGVIGIKERGELKWKPWKFRYEVGQPMGVISPIEMNVLYAGYDNKIQATASGFPNEKVTLAVPGASIAKGAQNIYTVKVPASMVGKSVKATVSGAGKQVGALEFRVRQLPKPQSYLGGVANTESRINRSQLAAALNSGVRLGYDESIPLKVAFRVTKFEVVVQVGAATRTIQCAGTISAEARALINQLKPGAALTITGIRGQGPSGEVRGAPIALIIQ